MSADRLTRKAPRLTPSPPGLGGGEGWGAGGEHWLSAPPGLKARIPSFLITLAAALLTFVSASLCSGQEIALPDGAILRLDRAGDAAPLDSLRELVFSPDSTRLAIRGEPESPASPRRLLVYDVRGRKMVAEISWKVPLVARMAFSADGRSVAASTPDAPEGVQVWSLPDGKEVRGLPSGRGPFVFLEQGGQLGILAPAGKNEVLRVHNVLSGEETQRFVLPVSYQSEFSADGHRVAMTLRFGDTDVRVLDLRTGKELRELRGGTRPPSVIRFGPDSRTLAAGFSDRTAQLWELSTGEPAFRLVGSTGTILATAFSQDGRFIATAGAEPVVRVWEVATGRAVHEFRGHTKPVTTLAFSPDGQMLASGGLDRTAIVWDASRISKTFLPAEPLDEKGMTKLWDDLSAASPAAAWPAIGRIRAAPEAIVPVIRDRVRTQLLPIDKSRIDQLVRNLGDADSLVRRRATDDLRKLREIARPALVRAAKESTSVEARARARRLLVLADNVPRYSPGDLRRMQRHVHAVEGTPGPDAQAILELISQELPEKSIARDAAETLERLRKQDRRS